MKHKLMSVATAAMMLGTVVFPVSVAAQANTAEPGRVRDTANNRCVKVQERIGGVLERYTELKQSQLQKYHRISEKVAQILDRAAAAGLPVADLRSQLAEFDTQVRELADRYEQVRAKLVEIQSMDCTANPEGYKAAFEQARELLKGVHDDAATLRGIYQEQIRPKLVELIKMMRPTPTVTPTVE